jgi:hypothetical protein
MEHTATTFTPMTTGTSVFPDFSLGLHSGCRRVIYPVRLLYDHRRLSSAVLEEMGVPLSSGGTQCFLRWSVMLTAAAVIGDAPCATPMEAPAVVTL